MFLATLLRFVVSSSPCGPCLSVTSVSSASLVVTSRLANPTPKSKRATFRITLTAIRTHLEGGSSVCWDAEPFSRGAYAWFKPGEMTDMMPHVPTPEARIHFAGGHTSQFPGWMNGALQSGYRAAKEINEASRVVWNLHSDHRRAACTLLSFACSTRKQYSRVQLDRVF